MLPLACLWLRQALDRCAVGSIRLSSDSVFGKLILFSASLKPAVSRAAAARGAAARPGPGTTPAHKTLHHAGSAGTRAADSVRSSKLFFKLKLKRPRACECRTHWA